jgi:hypothetical protein
MLKMFRKNPLYDATGRPFVLQEASAPRQAKEKKDHLHVVIHASTFQIQPSEDLRSFSLYELPHNNH